MTTKLAIFENKKIRTHWDEEKQEMYFSVVDVCAALSETKSTDPSAYWRNLKKRLKEEGSEVVSNCYGLKLPAADGKSYLTDTLNATGIFRLIQSIRKEHNNAAEFQTVEGVEEAGVNIMPSSFSYCSLPALVINLRHENSH